MIISDKIKLIRYEQELSRSQLSDLLNLSVRTLEGIENRGNDLRTSITQKLCSVFPEYTLWLMIDIVDFELGQVSPPIKDILKKEHYSLFPKEAFVFHRLIKQGVFRKHMKKVIKRYCKENHCEINEINYSSNVYRKLNIKRWAG